jgi:hypothetical protein
LDEAWLGREGYNVDGFAHTPWVKQFYAV